MKLLITATLLLAGSLASAEGLKTVIHSICTSADQSTYTVDMTSPVVLPDSTSLSDFQFKVAGLEQGIPLVDLVLSASGGLASTDRKTLSFEKTLIDPKIAAMFFPGNMLFVTMLNGNTSYITVKRCH